MFLLINIAEKLQNKSTEETAYFKQGKTLNKLKKIKMLNKIPANIFNTVSIPFIWKWWKTSNLSYKGNFKQQKKPVFAHRTISDFKFECCRKKPRFLQK